MRFGHRVLRVLVILLTFHGKLVFAHEGHQPLPTKGVQVDVAHGHVTLSAQAREPLAWRRKRFRSAMWFHRW